MAITNIGVTGGTAITSTLSAYANLTEIAQATLPADSTLSARGNLAEKALPEVFAAAGSLSALGAVGHRALLQLFLGSTSLSAQPQIGHGGTPQTLAAQGSLSALGAVGQSGTPQTLAAQGGLSAQPQVGQAAQVRLAATGELSVDGETLSPSGPTAWSGSVVMAAQGGLTAYGNLGISARATLPGRAGLSVNLLRVPIPPGPPNPGPTCNLLTEDGGWLLQEDGYALLLENCLVTPPVEPELPPRAISDGGGVWKKAGRGSGFSGTWYADAARRKRWRDLEEKEEQERRELEELALLAAKLADMPQPSGAEGLYRKIDLLAAETAESIRLAEEADLHRQRVAQINHEKALRILAQAEALLQDEEEALVLLMMD